MTLKKYSDLIFFKQIKLVSLTMKYLLDIHEIRWRGQTIDIYNKR